MKNMRRQADLKGGIIVPLAVAAGTVSGDAVALSATLFGIATTDRATADSITKGTAPQGLKAGQASVLLPGVALSLFAPAAQLTMADFAPVYFVVATKLYAAAGDVHVGWKIGPGEIGIRGNRI